MSDITFVGEFTRVVDMCTFKDRLYVATPDGVWVLNDDGVFERMKFKPIEAELKQEPPNHGPCAWCHEDVKHWYPWWTHNPDRTDLILKPQPLHEECFPKWQSKIDFPAEKIGLTAFKKT